MSAGLGAVPITDTRYAEIVAFLYEEAAILDEGRYEDWLGLLADDVTYRMPARLNRRTRGPGDASETTEIFRDDLASLRVRVARLGTAFAWAESPPSRTRHLVSNVRVWRTLAEDELEAVSYFLVYRNRSTSPTADLFSGQRRDRLRRVNGGWRLAARLITLDQAVLGARHISILL
jgi:3-phenylpropionate/cinnamic acid dioxygenase small subunit